MSRTKTIALFFALLIPITACKQVPQKSGAVEEYIVMAAKDCDEFHVVNATIFSPDDPRLKCERKKRTTQGKDIAERIIQDFKPVEDMAKKLGSVGSLNDVCLGPNPTDGTDQIEARMLMDNALIGTGSWMEGQPGCKEKLLIFLEPCSITMSQTRNKYGEPIKILKSGNSQFHFYGRMVLVEKEAGKIDIVLRRAIMGTQ